MRAARILTLLAFAPALCAQEAGLACLAAAAREQIGVTTRYDPAYVRLAYPGGDVPVDRGVCTDVIVRAYRRFGVDLQQQVHEDMRANFRDYPPLWGLSGPDRNIDHRRVPNLARWLARHGETLADDGEFLPGDLVTWRLPSGVPHIGIVSDRRGDAGDPLVLHNIGAGTREEDVLHAFDVTGHYRFRPREVVQACSARGDGG